MELLLGLFFSAVYFFIIVFAYFGFKGWAYLSVDSIVTALNNNFFVLSFIVAPVSYIVILSGIYSVFGWSLASLWLIVLAICIIRILVVIASSRLMRLPIVWLFSLSIISVLLAYGVQVTAFYSLSKGGTGGEVLLIMTIIAIFSVYVLFSNAHFGDFGVEESYHESTVRLYKKYVKKYARSIPKWYKKNSPQSLILFSIMITEDMNRPKIVRLVEKVTAKFYPGRTTGIMQVRHDEYLSDHRSIQLAAQIVKASFQARSKQIDEDYYLVRAVAEDYNGTMYADIVSDVFFTLKKHITTLTQDSA